MNDYEERKQARIDYYREKAEQARQESRQLYRQSSDMLSDIPLGQPILVDHHSARGHRRLLERADQKMGQSVAASEKAEYYEHKAEAAENNSAISSDDPDALDKLKERVAKLKANQAYMKKVNAYYRKHKTCQGCEGVSEEQAAELDESMKNAYSWETAPFPSYALSNNNQNIKRIEGRIQQLERAQESGYRGWDFEGGTVVPNQEENRLQIFFDGKPDVDTRTELKGNGFRWAPSVGAWQRQLTDNAIWAADRLACIRPLSGERPSQLQKKAQEKPSILKTMQEYPKEPGQEKPPTPTKEAER